MYAINTKPIQKSLKQSDNSREVTPLQDNWREIQMDNFQAW